MSRVAVLLGVLNLICVLLTFVMVQDLLLHLYVYYYYVLLST